VNEHLLTMGTKIADRLADPAQHPQLTEPALFIHQSMTGGAGVALLHIQRALAGADWEPACRWIAAAARGGVSAADQAGLYIGAPAVALALHTANADGQDRFTVARDEINRRVTDLAHRRVTTARTRMRRYLAAFREYDLGYGLTGIGALLLRTEPGGDALGRILEYLVALTNPIRVDDVFLPGWWADHDPDPATPTPDGHANLGIAHGITGPLALLGLATRAGIEVEGQRTAIEAIRTFLDSWRQEHEAGPWWPEWITRSELAAARPAHDHPPRPSWCYGATGIARAQQIAAIALGDTGWQREAETALAANLAPERLAEITDPGLCHGIAGITHTLHRAAADAITPALPALLPALTEQLAAVDPDTVGADLLDGAAGIALTAHTLTHETPTTWRWDTCLLTA